jgi:diguanylate cyclase (GGDEF)-like protein
MLISDTRKPMMTPPSRRRADGDQPPEPSAVRVLLVDDDDNFRACGDRILRDVGALFLSRTRSDDLIARWGGDEFVLLVRDLPFDDVTGAADRLVREVESMQWTTGDVMFGVGVSTGIAHSSLLRGATLEQLLDVADRDLYAKKWLKKHPGERPDLYEYPARSGAVLSLPDSAARDVPEIKRKLTE